MRAGSSLGTGSFGEDLWAGKTCPAASAKEQEVNPQPRHQALPWGQDEARHGCQIMSEGSGSGPVKVSRVRHSPR